MLIETNFSDVQTLVEGTGSEKQLYIEGIFAQGGVVNRNRRIYPSAILEKAMNEYDKEFIMKNRAVGEAEHPATTQVNLDRISHIIVPGSLNKEKDNYLAKARILNTPCGNIVRGLLEGGVSIGVSTRADGAVKQNSKGIMEVQDNLKMAAIDIVFSPSAPDAFVESLVEGEPYIWDTITEDTRFIESLKQEIKSTKKSTLNEAKVKVFYNFLAAIKG